jgi:thiol-disulfide isomerase/thioredoxin
MRRPPGARRVALLLATGLSLAAVAHAGQLRIGDSLPGVTLSDWQGGSVKLADLRGKVVILDFWASWCEVCRTALPKLDALARSHREDPVVIVAVNIDRDRARADQFLSDYLPQRHLMLLHDPRAELMARFGAGGMPTLYVVDRDGTVRDVKAGYHAQQLESLDPLLQQLLEPGPGPTARP